MTNAFGDRAIACTLHTFPLRLYIRVQHRARRISEPTLHLSTRNILQVSCCTSERATGSCGTDEAIQTCLTRLCPNFRTRSENVCLAVGDIVELVRPDGVLELLSVTRCLVVVVLWVSEWDSGNRVHLSSQHTKQVDLFIRLRVRHVNHTFVASRATHMSQTNARVSSRAFNDCATWLDQTLFLCI